MALLHTRVLLALIKSIMGEPLFDPKADSPLSDVVLLAKRNRYAGFDASRLLPQILSSQGTLLRYEQLGTGANAFDHLVFRVYLRHGSRVICRINTDSEVAEHFSKEAKLYGLWRAAGIPSPEVYEVKLRTSSAGFDYMLLQSVGTSDLEKYLTERREATLDYAHKAGVFLARLHVIKLPEFGMVQLVGDTLYGEQASWYEAITLRLADTLEYLTAQSLLPPNQVAAITDIFIRYKSLLSIPNGVTLHGDYHNANIIIDETKRTIVAAVDLTQAKAGDPLYDLAFYRTYVTPEVFATFCNGYFEGTLRPDDFEKKISLYSLRIYLSKAKLRKRFGYEDRIPAAIDGINQSLRHLL